MGAIPTLGARLARATFAPDLMLTDGISTVMTGNVTLGAEPTAVAEGLMPFARVFETLWAGKRHVMMGASQIDLHGNQNISCIGDWKKPKVQLLGVRGAPGNTLNHTTSYWVPRHSARVFVPRVDVVSGVGYDRAAALGPVTARFHEIRRVVTDLAVLDFVVPEDTADGGGGPARMRLASVHPGVRVEDVEAATGFPLLVPKTVPTTRQPTADELSLLRKTLDLEGITRPESG